MYPPEPSDEELAETLKMADANGEEYEGQFHSERQTMHDRYPDRYPKPDPKPSGPFPY